jgi:hypothetical protein
MALEVLGITVDSEPSAENNFSLAVDIWSVGKIGIEIYSELGSYGFQDICLILRWNRLTHGNAEEVLGSRQISEERAGY